MLPQLEWTIPALDNSYESVNTTHYYVAVKGMYPINTQWGLFGKIGYDSMSVASTDINIGRVTESTPSYNPSGLLLAFGGSYTLNTNLAVTAAYNQLLDSATVQGTSTNVNVGYATVGLTYLF